MHNASIYIRGVREPFEVFATIVLLHILWLANVLKSTHLNTKKVQNIIKTNTIANGNANWNRNIGWFRKCIFIYILVGLRLMQGDYFVWLKSFNTVNIMSRKNG